MAQITVDTNNPKEAIKAIRKAARAEKKEELRKSALRGIALQRAESNAFKMVRAASSDYLVGWSVYRPDGNEYARRGYNRLVLNDGTLLTVQTHDGTGSFGVWTPSKITHIIEDGAGWILGAVYQMGDDARSWLAFGVAEDITYHTQIDGKLAEMCDEFLARLIAHREKKDAERAAANPL
jgi:hypothetical protein